MNYKNIFTEYDSSLEKSLDIDPMGFSVIWTHFGQEIFNNKISSVALDVRSFTINLFNHFIIKNLMNNSSEEIIYLFERDRKSAVEKLLVVLENMIIWSWKESENEDGTNQWGDAKIGLLGTSKAITKWNDGIEININLDDDVKDLELLKRQKTLGVNGRYKGSFVNMEFFDANYDKYLEDDIFDSIKTLIENNEDLKNLYINVMKFFASNKREVNQIPTECYTKVFANFDSIAKYTKVFWLENLGFTTAEAKEVYESVSIDEDMLMIEIFNAANATLQSPKLEIIMELEPKLSYIDSLFKYILLCDGEEVEKLSEKPCFEKLKDFDFNDERMTIAKDCGAKSKVEKLSDVKTIKNLIDYHKQIMEERGHTPWLKDDNGILDVSIKIRDKKDKIEEILKKNLEDMSWIHSYYLGSVINIKKAFEK